MLETYQQRWRSRAVPQFGICLAILLLITVIRLIGLRYSVVDFFVDEAQYWDWSREFAFGYFSKPPLLAWIIAGANAVCGSAEACIRAPSPIFYLGTALLGYAIARELYDENSAFWTALTIALAPGVAFSSRIISTDVPLLFFWALALLAYVKLLRGGDFLWAIVLGGALGLGLLAKYAMIYFLLGIAVVVVVDSDARQVLLRKEPWIALAIGAFLVAPNIFWNARHRFDTFKQSLVDTDRFGFNPSSGLEFFGAQFGVIGPIIFGGLLSLLVSWYGLRLRREDRWMLAFAIPPLALITILAFVHGAYINWAATAFISAAIVVSVCWSERRNGCGLRQTWSLVLSYKLYFWSVTHRLTRLRYRYSAGKTIRIDGRWDGITSRTRPVVSLSEWERGQSSAKTETRLLRWFTTSGTRSRAFWNGRTRSRPKTILSEPSH